MPPPEYLPSSPVLIPRSWVPSTVTTVVRVESTTKVVIPGS